jgi:hypothetical protein
MGRGVGVGWIRWHWWWDRAFTNASRGMGLGAKRPKPSAAARFWVCHIKREWRAMGGGVGVGWMRWQRWWGPAFVNASRGRGLGAKRPKPSAAARFWVCRVNWQWRTMGGGGGAMWTRWWWYCACAFEHAQGRRGQGQKNLKTRKLSH